MPGYNTYFSSSKRNQNGSVIVFVKFGLTINLCDFGSVESNILKLPLCVNNTSLVFYCVYVSPANNTNGFFTKNTLHFW